MNEAVLDYPWFFKQIWESVRAANPDVKVYDIGRIIGGLWRDLPQEGKQVYLEQYELDKQDYNRALKAYHDSPAYQSWLQESRG